MIWTDNEVRSNGFWVVKCNTVVRSLVGKCVKCRLLRGKLGEQKMADLPTDRTLDGPPFTNRRVDIFGPFLIKQGRKKTAEKIQDTFHLFSKHGSPY